jgi:hypothetical protein
MAIVIVAMIDVPVSAGDPMDAAADDYFHRVDDGERLDNVLAGPHPPPDTAP